MLISRSELQSVRCKPRLTSEGRRRTRRRCIELALRLYIYYTYICYDGTGLDHLRVLHTTAVVSLNHSFMTTKEAIRNQPRHWLAPSTFQNESSIPFSVTTCMLELTGGRLLTYRTQGHLILSGCQWNARLTQHRLHVSTPLVLD